MVQFLRNNSLNKNLSSSLHQLCCKCILTTYVSPYPLTFVAQHKRSPRIRPATAALTIMSSGFGYGHGGTAKPKSNAQEDNRRAVTAVQYNYPPDLVEGANEFLQDTGGVNAHVPKTNDWNLNQYAARQGHSTVLRNESVQFFSNLRLMYTTGMKMKFQTPRPFTAHPDLLQLEEDEVWQKRPSNLPAYCLPNWYPVDDPYFESDNPLVGGMFTTGATYTAEMDRVPLRKWESTNLGRLMESDDRSVVGGGVRFTVMSYNVLSPRLLEQHMYLYGDHDPQALDWEYRCRTFFAEIQHYQVDIIGLQEIDSALVPMYDQLFEEIGFKGVFKKRTRDKEDGCAIYYRTSKFGLVDKLSIEFYQPHVSLLDRDNVGILVKLETKQGRKHKVVVGTTHLLFNPKRHDVKLAQVQLLLAELDRFSFCGLDKDGLPIYYPTMMTGDFNTDPVSPISKLITEGILQHVDEHGRAIIPLKRRGADAFIPPYFGISDQCQHYKVVNARINCQKAKKSSNFEIETTASNALVNVLRSDEYDSAIQAVETFRLKVQDNGSRFAQSSSMNRTASDISFVAASIMSDDLPSRTDFSMHQNQIDESSMPSTPSVDSKVLNKIMEHGTLCTFGSGEFSHKFNFRDVHGPKLDRQGSNEGVATTRQNGWVCVDYIYYSMVWNNKFGKLIEGKLKLIRRLGLLNRTQCKELGSIPRQDIPSDHFPLVAEFLLKN